MLESHHCFVDCHGFYLRCVFSLSVRTYITLKADNSKSILQKFRTYNEQKEEDQIV